MCTILNTMLSNRLRIQRDFHVVQTLVDLKLLSPAVAIRERIINDNNGLLFRSESLVFCSSDLSSRNIITKLLLLLLLIINWEHIFSIYRTVSVL